MQERPVTVLFSAEEIAARVDGLAKEVAAGMTRDLMVVAVLKGSFMFTADLLRALHRAGVRPQVDFMTLGSYGVGTESSGRMMILRNTTDPVESDFVGFACPDRFVVGYGLDLAHHYRELPYIGAFEDT